MRLGRILRLLFTAALLVSLPAWQAVADHTDSLRQEGPAFSPDDPLQKEGEGMAPLPEADLPWVFEHVDAPRRFSDMGDRSIALDASGYPHIAYGRDHLYYAAFDGDAWHIETVDPSWGVGQHTSLRLDSAGRPHISYFDAAYEALRYARHDGSCWHIETVTDVEVSGNNCLDLDENDRPHIAFREGLTGVKYAWRNGATWQIETVEVSEDFFGWDVSLALDRSGRPHIFFDRYLFLKYAYHDGTAWQISVVGAGGAYFSTVIDGEDRPHVTYSDSDGLQHVWHDGAVWQSETVDSAYGLNTSLALDASGRPRVAYCRYLSYPHCECDELRYAWYDGTSWYTETVDSEGWVGEFASLGLDGSGQPHISYWGEESLKHAWHDTDSWYTETVDREQTVGLFTSLALDSGDLPHIAYYDESNGDLKYTRREGSNWHLETVDSGGDVGTYASLALDAERHPHIGYLDRTNGDLKYAHYDGAAWGIETVDSAGAVGEYASLALDAEGHPHIAYYDATNADLKVARCDGTCLGQTQGWQIEVVDSAGDVGLHTSLALDSGGHPHVSYYDDTSEEVKHAWYDGLSWNIEIADDDAELDDSSGTSLALDDADRPHISYSDGHQGYLVIAWPNATFWHKLIVQWNYLIDWGYVSLALDGAQRPHLSYMRSTNIRDKVLKYAWRDGTGLHTEVVDGLGTVGEYTSLALDSAGRSHISYFDETCGDLKYAYQTCSSLNGVRIVGPLALVANRPGTYQAVPEPITATLPIVFTWDSGAAGPKVVYSWQATGTHTVSVTATNVCGDAAQRASLQVEVIDAWPYSFYLPLVAQDWG